MACWRSGLFTGLLLDLDSGCSSDLDLDLDLDFENDAGDEELGAEMTIDGIENEEFGLNDEDLRNLLD